MKRKIWNEENIKAAFDRFEKEHGHLPTALEVDQTDYLPSSRHIQRDFGGLQKLRLRLGYKDSHFGKGVFRTEIANKTNKRGRNAEQELESLLRNRFGEVFVHTEKMFGIGKNRVDFYIYSPEGNFGVDVFYPDNFKTLQSNLNIKQKKYFDFSEQLYYVVANQEINQDYLEESIRFKKNPLSSNETLVSVCLFLKLIQNIKTYPDPLQSKKK